MENISYHGTSKEKSFSVIKGIDLSLGRGELGKGFYTGTSIAMAKIWAKQRFGSNGVVIEFEIDKSKFVLLEGHVIGSRKGVLIFWNKLKENKTTTSHTFGKDYVIAPFATNDVGHQIKFESKKAAEELNNSKKVIY